MEFIEALLALIAEHPALSRFLAEGTILGGVLLKLYTGEKKNKIVSRFIAFLGHKLSPRILADVQIQQEAMRDEINAEIFKSRQLGEERSKIAHDELIAVNKELDAKIEKLEYRIDVMDMLSYRTELVNFADYLITHPDRQVSSDKWRNILRIKDTYEDFCTKHKRFPNSECQEAIDHIMGCYRIRQVMYHEGKDE